MRISTTATLMMKSALRRTVLRWNRSGRNKKWVGMSIPTHFHKNRELTFQGAEVLYGLLPSLGNFHNRKEYSIIPKISEL